ncbi:HDOD domain-containing protein [Saccharospirillum impatiens]|uniref:HDOD domain-containing protein n=1 Tax=Saccharospirillum impatiens TaxID=169438 RepID=UPI00040F4555|nr:HDOD domain-containing protein [Saccharospirillum impatiens]
MNDVRGLKAWLKVIAKLDLPSLNSVVKAICELSDDDDSSADEFTQIVLRDADLTSQVLKVANSVHYNRSFSPIKTVSRAIVQIGYMDLKNIALATTLIDGFLDGKPRDRLINNLARSFHAAVQARAIAQQLKGDDHEEVFIAALLLRLGDLALLATGRPEVDTFMAARDLSPGEAHSLALEHLGVGVKTLNRALIQEWGLGDLVLKASDDRHSADPWVRSVQFGDEISQTIHLGIDHPDMRKVIQRISEFQDRSSTDVREHILLMAEEASSVAATYGAERLLQALPQRDVIEGDTTAVQPTDHDMQRFLNRISRCIMDVEPLPRLLQLAVHALHRGAGFGRVALWLSSARDHRLEPVIVAGDDVARWREVLKLDLSTLHQEETLAVFLKAPEPRWYTRKAPTDGVMRRLLGTVDGMMVPVQSPDRLVGVIYADNDGDALTERQFEELQLVANQINLYLQFNMSAQPKSG